MAKSRRMKRSRKSRSTLKRKMSKRRMSKRKMSKRRMSKRRMTKGGRLNCYDDRGYVDNKEGMYDAFGDVQEGCPKGVTSYDDDDNTSMSWGERRGY